MIDDTAVLHRRAEPLTAEVDGETVMFDPTAGKYFALGAVGSRVWELLETPMSFADLCERVRADFDVDPETCRADVEPFIGQLEDAKLVEVRA